VLKKLFPLFAVLFVIGIGTLVFRFYGYIFAKSIVGVIVKVERVNENQMIIANSTQNPSAQIFSYAVAVKDSKGEIHTASSEDRQWAVAQSGQCADAKFFPYPPWQLDKSGTYHGARLLRLYECQSEAAGTGGAPTPSPAKH
jgi:hypothetical protein